MPSVMVIDVTETFAEATMASVFRLRSLPDVPTLPSMTMVEPFAARIRYHVAVPVAFAEESAVMVEKARKPPDTVPEGPASVSSARRVVAAPPVAGRVPS